MLRLRLDGGEIGNIKKKWEKIGFEVILIRREKWEIFLWGSSIFSPIQLKIDPSKMESKVGKKRIGHFRQKCLLQI